MRTFYLMLALFLIGALMGRANAQDEYYTLSNAVTQNVTGDAAGNNGVALGPLTVSGWIETDGFGKSGCNANPCVFNPLIIGWQVNITYDGVTETMNSNYSPVPEDGWHVVATPKGLFCNQCNFSNEGYPFFLFGSARTGGAFYQFETDTPPAGASDTLDFVSPVLKNNFRIGNYPTTTMPGAAMLPAGRAAAPELDASGAGAALTLLMGTALVLRGRRK